MAKNTTIEQLDRRDGRIAFSSGGRRLSEVRRDAAKSRIGKILGKDGPFSIAFKAAVLRDHDQILERTFLEKELSGAKRILNALSKAKAGSASSKLLNRLNADPTKTKHNNILCPIWRHVNAMDLTAAAMSRYLFPEKSEEIYFVTAIFNFAENLFELEDQLMVAQGTIQTVVKRMTKQRRGVVIAGCFEPDLRTFGELTRQNSDLARFLTELGRTAPDTGGWVLSGHFIVRVPHHQDLRQFLQDALPSKGWTRVQFKQIRDDETLAHQMMYLLGYAAKYPKPLFDPPTRGKGKLIADKMCLAMNAAFMGPSFTKFDKDHAFGVEEAISQWALFVDRMGPNNMYVSIENAHAQKWFSQSEWNYIREIDADLRSDGQHLIELLRDRELTNARKKIDTRNGQLRRLRSRPLKFDHEWLLSTDLEGVDPYTQPVNLFDWMVIGRASADAEQEEGDGVLRTPTTKIAKSGSRGTA